MPKVMANFADDHNDLDECRNFGQLIVIISHNDYMLHVRVPIHQAVGHCRKRRKLFNCLLLLLRILRHDMDMLIS